jgi:hypothetical protein
MPAITYGELLSYLRRLGFHEAGRAGLDAVWQHSASGIVVVLSPAESNEPVRGADLLSVETRLQHHDLLDGSIQRAIVTARVH